MRRLFAFALSRIRFYITVHKAGVGKRKVMQKGAFAYKGDEKCVIHKNLLQRFNIKECLCESGPVDFTRGTDFARFLCD